ncbi:F0F1 ATP synthase subunit A [Jannaschia seohaensis]|uniref:ATP synthase subunit a n=1 Tax=Jannaschia seohaensis TaxID=475081 RepID=A0A2Y9API6_9RHOB|nr:F0F1 ATP synthase subunit A [Jannaschia seohaensis]PWJ20252.1 F-type H+-transporting ATPase subunit a [Jannaschia seohaensis]SSA44259.1 F-type H+-transporting ATPase subunit a [Jannaschia seohaensis]
MDGSPLSPDILVWIGPVPISRAVVTTWVIMGVLAAVLTATLRLARPGSGLATALEILVTTLSGQIRVILGRDPRPFLPLLGSLFIFIVLANLAAVFPGATPPTAHVETPAALALIVFLSVHFYGIQAKGLRGYLRHYLEPNPFLLPLNVLSEPTRTFSLMIRLFGNMMSHEFVIAIVVFLAGLLLPIPFLLLGVLIGIIQAYIFTVLATVYIGAAVGAVDA